MAALAALLIVVGVASATPNLRFVSWDPADIIIRKAGHVFVYGGVAYIALVVATSGRASRASGVTPWLVIIMTAMVGVLDEVHQGMVAGRRPSILDVGLDVVGACAGVVAGIRTRRAQAAPR